MSRTFSSKTIASKTLSSKSFSTKVFNRYRDDAKAYFDAVEALGGAFTTAEKGDVNTLFGSIDITQFGRFYYHAASDQHGSRAAARVSLANPTSTPITEVNSPTWTAGQGYTGDGATTYLNTNYGSGAVNYAKNDICFGVYVRNNVQSNIAIGNVNATGTSENYIWPRFTDNNSYCSANATGSPATVATTDSRGLLVSRRNNSANMQGFKNGVQVSTVVVASATTPPADFYILASDMEGVGPTNFSTFQVAISFIARDLADHAALYTAIQAFATARGFNV